MRFNNALRSDWMFFNVRIDTFRRVIGLQQLSFKQRDAPRPKLKRCVDG